MNWRERLLVLEPLAAIARVAKSSLALGPLRLCSEGRGARVFSISALYSIFTAIVCEA